MKIIGIVKILFFCLFSFYNDLVGQDLITKKNGEDIKAKVIEIGTQEVKYKKEENLNGPTYVILKEEILIIRYENGQKEIFNAQSEPAIKNISNSTNKAYEVLERSGYNLEELPVEEGGKIIWKGQVKTKGLSPEDLSMKITQWCYQKGYTLHQNIIASGVITFNGNFKISKGGSKEYTCTDKVNFYIDGDGFKYDIRDVHLTRHSLESFYYNKDRDLVKDLKIAFKNINTEMIKLSKEIQLIF